MANIWYPKTLGRTLNFVRDAGATQLLLILCFSAPGVAQEAAAERRFVVHEASIPELQAALTTRRVTSVELVDAYRARIAAYDERGPALNAIVRLNPRARVEAVALDRERRERGPRGPLHGIPVLLKDNYDARNLPTSGSSLALAGLVPPDDAFQVRKLREAGAVILGKTNMHELASGVTTVSSLGGQTRNPYDPMRNPGGSSGGTGAAVAASFAAVGWGTDTCGSIRIPAAANNLFGLRPTKGLSSIDGILPLSHTQDVGGPLTRTIVDLAVTLDATVGQDPADPATAALEGRTLPTFQAALDAGALKGARIGVLAAWLSDDAAAQEVISVVRHALEQMEEAGARIVELEHLDPDTLLTRTSVIDYEFKFDLADYLASVPGAPVGTLGEIIASGLHHEALDGRLRRRDQPQTADSEEYRERLERQVALREALVRLMDEESLDALAYPTLRSVPALIGGSPRFGGTCGLSGHTGLPALSIPAGFTESALPAAVELLGRPFDDHRLVALGYAFEGIAHPRRAPLRTPPLVDGRSPEPVRFGVTGRGSPQSQSDVGTPFDLQGTFALDLTQGVLRYTITTSGRMSEQIHAMVLLRKRGSLPTSVVARLSPPGSVSAAGELVLTPRLLQDLIEGNVDLAVHTRESPLGAVSVSLEPPAGPWSSGQVTPNR